MRYFTLFSLALLFIVVAFPYNSAQKSAPGIVRTTQEETPCSLTLQSISAAGITLSVENLTTHEYKKEYLLNSTVKTICGIPLYIIKVKIISKGKNTATVAIVKTAQTFTDQENTMDDVNQKPINNSATKFTILNNQIAAITINGEPHAIMPPVTPVNSPTLIEIAQRGTWWVRQVKSPSTGAKWSLSVVSGKDIALTEWNPYPERKQDIAYTSLQETENNLNLLIKQLHTANSDMSKIILSFLDEIKVFAMIGSLTQNYWEIVLSNNKDAVKDKRYNEILIWTDLINQFIRDNQRFVR